MPAASDVLLVAVIAGAGLGAAIDLRTRRIPNAVSMGTALLGLALAALGVSGVSVASSLGGFALGLGLFLPGYALGATGAGDVKLMAGVGAILGAKLILVALACTAIVGGAIALAVATARGRLFLTLGGTGRLLAAPGVARASIESAGARSRFSYGPAIAIGAAMAAWLAR